MFLRILQLEGEITLLQSTKLPKILSLWLITLESTKFDKLIFFTVFITNGVFIKV